jgi:two-component system response regulator HydG
MAGNLRELKNVIKRAALLSDGDKIKAQALPFEISHYSKLSFTEKEIENTTRHEEPKPVRDHFHNLKEAAKEAEYETILRVLKEVNFNKSKAAKVLNIDRKTLYNKIKIFNDSELKMSQSGIANGE